MCRFSACLLGLLTALSVPHHILSQESQDCTVLGIQELSILYQNLLEEYNTLGGTVTEGVEIGDLLYWDGTSWSYCSWHHVLFYHSWDGQLFYTKYGMCGCIKPHSTDFSWEKAPLSILGTL